MNRKMTLTEPDHIRHAREMSVRWLLMPTTKQKKTYIQICPRTQVNSDYYGYYPVAAENYRKTSQSKYMILNENHICLNRYGEIAEDGFVSQGAQTYRLSSGRYFYYEIVAAIGDMLIEEPVEFIVSNEDKDYRQIYFDHDYRAIKIHIEAKKTENIDTDLQISQEQWRNLPNRPESINCEYSIVYPKTFYYIYEDITNIEYLSKDYTNIIEKKFFNGSKHTELSFADIGILEVDGTKTEWVIRDIIEYEYETADQAVPAITVNGETYGRNRGVLVTDAYYPYDERAFLLHYSSNEIWNVYRFGQYIKEKRTKISNPPFSSIIKTEYKNGFEFELNANVPEYTDINIVEYEDGTIEDYSTTYENKTDFIYRFSGVFNDSGLISNIHYLITGKYTTPRQLAVKVYEKSKNEYQTVEYRSNNTSVYTSGVSDDEIQDCFNIIIARTQQAREGYEKYLD